MRQLLLLLSLAIFLVVGLALCPDAVFAGQLYGSNFTDITIPDYDEYGTWSAISLSGAPSGSVVTSVEYRVRIANVYVSDIELELESPDGAHTIIWPQGTGGATDGGYDDDTEDDSDIYLNWRVEGSFFDGKNPNGTWYLDAWDLVQDDQGYIDYFEIKVNYDEPSKPDLIISYLSPATVNAVAGQPFTLSTKVKNQGSGSASSSTVGWYQSSSTGSHGAPVASSSVGSLGAGLESGVISQAFILNDQGTVYFFTRADKDNQVTESDETNNYSDEGTLSPRYGACRRIRLAIHLGC